MTMGNTFPSTTRRRGAAWQLRRLIELVFDTMAAIGIVWIGVIMLMIMADVMGRNLFSAPVTGVAEIAARSVVAIVFLMMPAAALRNKLIRADFLVRFIQRAAPGLMRLIDAVFALVGAWVFVLVSISAWPDTLSAWMTHEFFGVQGVWTLPSFPFRLIIVISGYATAIAILLAAFMPQSDDYGPASEH